MFDAFQTFLSFFQGSLLALLLLGMLWRRTTQWGGLSGMLVGVGHRGRWSSSTAIPRVRRHNIVSVGGLVVVCRGHDQRQSWSVC